MAIALGVSLALGLATPWTESRLPEAGATQASTSGPSGLRWAAVERDVVSHLGRRPADAAAWVTLAWLRAPRSAAEAVGLARWGTRLDPEREKLRRAAEDLAKSLGSR